MSTFTVRMTCELAPSELFGSGPGMAPMKDWPVYSVAMVTFREDSEMEELEAKVMTQAQLSTRALVERMERRRNSLEAQAEARRAEDGK